MNNAAASKATLTLIPMLQAYKGDNERAQEIFAEILDKKEF